jgi:hypothetical protein
MTSQDPAERAKPRCPRCGSSDVREWDLVPVPYVATELARDRRGQVRVADTDEAGLPPAWDAGRFESLMCNACEYESSDCAEFFPEPAVVLGEN